MSKQTELNFTGKCCCHCGLVPERLTEVNEKLWCPSCLQTFFSKCSHCHNFKPMGERKSIRDTGGYGKVVCGLCFVDYYNQCEHCNYGSKKSDIRQWEGHSYCSHCYDNMFVCVSCQRRQFHEQSADAGICRGCFEEERRIINPQHDAKIKLDFQGEGPHFYGIELEVECDEKINRRPQFAKQILKLFDGFVMAKHDGSIVDRNGKNIGFEIVTVPASREIQYDKWNHFFDNLPKGLRSYDTKTCGLHVHASRNPLSQLTIAKILLFMNRKENIPFITTIAGRSANRYCQIKDKVFKDARYGTMDRYEALNLVNKGTIEFRIFRGTLKRESLFKSLEFCDALIYFCKECSYSIRDCQKVDKFLEYVKLRKKDYIHLWAFICARWLRQENDLTRKMGFPLPDKPAEVESYNNEPNPELRNDGNI